MLAQPGPRCKALASAASAEREGGTPPLSDGALILLRGPQPPHARPMSVAVPSIVSTASGPPLYLMSTEVPFFTFSTVISLPLCGHSAAQRLKLSMVVFSSTPTIVPSDTPETVTQGWPTVHSIVFWLVRVNVRPRPVVPLSSAFHTMRRALPLAVTMAAACHVSMVARLILKPCDS